jgi:hypothetical protein
MFVFAAFTALFWPAAGLVPATGRGRIRDGFLAAVTIVVKVAQVHPIANLLRHRPWSALLAVLLMGGIAVLTLPILGIEPWTDWIAHVQKAGDPAWKPIGTPLSTLIPREVALVVTALSVAGALLVGGRRRGAWIGLLMLVGAPSLHMFALVYLLPALLLVRREVALIAAILVATYLNVGVWAAIALTAWALIASTRFAWLEEPARTAPHGAPA